MPKQTDLDDFTQEDLINVSFDFWKFKEDKEVIGVFSRWESDSFGEHAVLVMGENEMHLPNLTALNGKLKKRNVKPKEKVKIVYKGQMKAKSSGRTYEDFDVYIKR